MSGWRIRCPLLSRPFLIHAHASKHACKHRPHGDIMQYPGERERSEGILSLLSPSDEERVRFQLQLQLQLFCSAVASSVIKEAAILFPRGTFAGRRTRRSPPPRTIARTEMQRGKGCQRTRQKEDRGRGARRGRREKERESEREKVPVLCPPFPSQALFLHYILELGPVGHLITPQVI